MCADDPDWIRDMTTSQGCAKVAAKKATGTNDQWCSYGIANFLGTGGLYANEACPVACGQCDKWDISGMVSKEVAVEELSLLLTSGRLSAKTREIIEEEYEKELRRFSGTQESAMRIAESLFVVAPEFHATNTVESMEEEKEEEEEESGPDTGGEYKAIVYMMMFGAADSYNFLVPKDECDKAGKDMFAEYAEVRTNAGLAKWELLEIDAGAPGVQVCDKFGLHPKLMEVQRLYQQGDAAWVSNIGVLTEPVSQQDFYDKKGHVPPSLFAHNSQADAIHSGVPHEVAANVGWLGRLKDALVGKGMGVGSYSISANAKVLEPDTSSLPDVIDRKNGVALIEQDMLGSRREAILNLTNIKSGSVYAEAWTSSVRNTLERTAFLHDAIDGVETTENFGSSNLGSQFGQVSRLIRANKDKIGNSRDIFFVQRGGWDTHSDLGGVLSSNLAEVDTTVGKFEKEMKDMGLWDNVVVVSVSDFSRTLTSNGVGTDHAWGGNHVVMGGAVKGGKVLGKFIDDYTEEGPLHIGRGRLIPTSPWESIWAPLCRWFGAGEVDELAAILPNLQNFAVEVQADLF